MERTEYVVYPRLPVNKTGPIARLILITYDCGHRVTKPYTKRLTQQLNFNCLSCP